MNSNKQKLIAETEPEFFNVDDIVKDPNEVKFPTLLDGLSPLFRLIVSAPSGLGKTNLIWHLIMNYVYFDELHVFSLSLDQPKYQWLIEFFKKLHEKRQEEWEKEQRRKNKNKKKTLLPNGNEVIKELHLDEEEDKPPVPMAYWYDDINEFPSIEDFNRDYHKHKLIVLDDCLALDQSLFSDIYVRIRHTKSSVIYATQKYTALPTVITENSTHDIFIGKPNTDLLNAIVRSVNIGPDYKGLKKLFKENIINTYDFLLISRYSPPGSKVRVNGKKSKMIDERNYMDL